MQAIVLLGAPLNEQLRRTWGDAEERSTIPPAAWRHIIPNATISQELDESVLEESYAVHEDSIATQLPTFNFDMSNVLDLEDLDDQSLVDKNSRAISYSILCAVLSISPAKDIVTRAGNQTQVVILTVGDHTRGRFELAVWASHAQYVQKFLRRLDVILCHDIALSTFKGILGGTSRANRSRFTVLYRTDRQSRHDDQLRPLLLDDLQSLRVKRVRDWALAWIPSETQPESEISIQGLR